MGGQGMYGADVAQLKQLAGVLERAADRLDKSRVKVTDGIRVAAWIGPVAVRFRATWDSTYRPNLQSAANLLRANAKTLRSNAEDQDQTSRATGVGTSPAAFASGSVEQERETAVEVAAFTTGLGTGLVVEKGAASAFARATGNAAFSRAAGGIVGGFSGATAGGVLEISSRLASGENPAPAIRKTINSTAGAAAGAVIGSFVPVPIVGTVVGAGIGWGIGTVMNAMWDSGLGKIFGF